MKYFYKVYFNNGEFSKALLFDYEDNCSFSYENEAYFSELITRLVLFSKKHSQNEKISGKLKTIYGYIR